MELLDQLKAMHPLQLRELALRYGLPSIYLPENPEPIKVAMDLLQFAKGREGEDTPRLRKLITEMVLLEFKHKSKIKWWMILSSVSASIIGLVVLTVVAIFYFGESDPILNLEHEIKKLQQQASNKERVKNWKEAENIYARIHNKQNQLIEITKKHGGMEPILNDIHLEIARTLEKMGQLRLSQLKYVDATEYFIKATNFAKSNDVMRSTLFFSAGQAWLQIAEYEEAEKCLQKALKIEKEKSFNRVKILVISSMLAETFRKWGKFTQAEKIYRDLDNELNAKLELSPNDENTRLRLSTVKNDWGLLYQEQNQYDKALKLYKAALRIREQYPHHQELLAEAKANLAALHHSQGRQEKNEIKAQQEFTKAQRLYQEALSINKQLPKLHPSILTIRHNLAALHRDQKNYDTALTEFEKVVKDKQLLFPKNRQSLATTQEEQAKILFKQKKFDSAREEFKQVLKIRKELSNPQHPEIGKSLYNLALLEKTTNNYLLSTDYAERALSIFQHAKLDDDAQQCRKLLVSVWMMLARESTSDEAKALYQKALDMYRAFSQPDADFIHLLEASISNLETTTQ